MPKPFAAIRAAKDIPPSLDRRLTEAYLRTTYRVSEPPIEIRIGQSCPAADRLLAEHGLATWAFVTAWNPRSQPLFFSKNAHQQALFEETVRAGGWPHFRGAGEGENGDWPPEPSLLILGISAAGAIRLGQKFEQNALVFGQKNGEAELWWLP